MLSMKQVKGWQVLLGGILAYWGIVAAASLLFPDAHLLIRLGVPVLTPSFADTRNILSAMECQRRGFDVLLQNPCDPWGRSLPYPRLWLWPDLDQSWTVPLGIAIGIIFIAAVLWLFRKLNPREAATTLAVVLSPAVVLVIERANADALVFAGLIGAIALLSGPRRMWRLAGYVLLAILGMAKLFPFAAFAVALRERRPWSFVIIAAAIAIAGCYALLTFDDLREMAPIISRPTVWAYGAKILPLQIVMNAGAHGLIIDPGVAVTVAYLVLALLAAGGFLVAGRLRSAGDSEGVQLEEADESGFVAGCAIYLFSFMTAQNFDYRLIFLLPCLPQLFAWRRLPGPLHWLGTRGHAGSDPRSVDSLLHAELGQECVRRFASPFIALARAGSVR